MIIRISNNKNYINKLVKNWYELNTEQFNISVSLSLAEDVSPLSVPDSYNSLIYVTAQDKNNFNLPEKEIHLPQKLYLIVKGYSVSIAEKTYQINTDTDLIMIYNLLNTELTLEKV